MARSDSLHMTMLTTSLSVVKACLVGYLHANNGASIAASLAPAPRRARRRSRRPTATPAPRCCARARSRPSTCAASRSRTAAGRQGGGAHRRDAAAPGLADEALAPWPLEPEAFWALARLLVQLATAGPPAHAPAEQRRQAALDVLKLLDAVLCCHPPLVAPFLALPALPRAYAAAHPPARGQRAAAGVAPRAGRLPRPAGGGGPRARAARGAAPRRRAAPPPPPSSGSSSPTSSRCPPPPRRRVAAAKGRTSASDGHARLCGTLLGLALGYPRALRDEKVVLGLLALLATLARTSASCAASSARASASCARRVVGAGGDAASTAVRHAGIGLLLATVGADGGQRSLGALLPVVDEMHARDASDEWPTRRAPAQDPRRPRQPGGDVLHELAAPAALRIAALPRRPPRRRAAAAAAHRRLLRAQRAFAHMRDGLLPVYDAVELVRACEEMPLSYGGFQQNDAAEFLMLAATSRRRSRGRRTPRCYPSASARWSTR